MLPKILLSLLFLSMFLSNNLNAEFLENAKYIGSFSGKKLLIIRDDKWKSIGSGVDFKIIKLVRSESGLDIVIKFLRVDLKLIRAKVVYSKNSETRFKNVKNIIEKDDAIAAINGSYFDVNGNPLGLLIAGGKIINNRIVTHPLYSGIFYIKEDMPYIVYKDNFQSSGVTEAIQVGPILIADGKDAEDFIAKNLDYFYNSLDPIKGAVETINYLNKHHKVSIITARKIHAFDITEKWLIKNSINYSNLCLTNGSSKVKFCKQLGIDIIIEDSSPNALEISSSGIPVILITTEYNSNLKGNMITHCKDWKEIRNAIKTFEKKLLICK